MDIRAFQIIVPLLAGLFFLWQLLRVYQTKTNWKSIWPGLVFAFGLALVALFPDRITNYLADLLDFESNVNAILFVLIGGLMVAFIILYDLYRKQQKSITQLTIELSVLLAEKQENTKKNS